VKRPSNLKCPEGKKRFTETKRPVPNQKLKRRGKRKERQNWGVGLIQVSILACGQHVVLQVH